MALFLNLYLGHLLGDYVFQPAPLVAAKRSGAAWLALHAAIVGACTAAVFGPDFVARWPLVALVAAVHLAIDSVTVLGYTRTGVRGLLLFLADQVAHAAVLAAAAWFGGAAFTDLEGRAFGLQVTAPVLAAACGILTVALLGSILAFEAGDAVAGRSRNRRILAFDLPRLAGIAERTGGLALALSLSSAFAPLAFVPRIALAMRLDRKGRARQLAEAFAGLLLCLIVAGLIRLVTGMSV